VFKDGLAKLVEEVKAQAAERYLPKPAKAAAPESASTPPPAAQAAPARAKGKKSTAPAALARDNARASPKTSKAEASADIAAALGALEGESNQAPAAQGNDAQAVPVGQPAASVAPGATGSAFVPAAAWPFPNHTPEAQAATSVAAPSGKDSAGASIGAAAKEIAPGVRVRINETAIGKQQKPWIDYQGVVVEAIGDRAWDVAIERSKRSAPKRVAFDASELEVVE